MNLHAGWGIAVREFQLKPRHGYADYLLYVDGQAVGVVEAKKEGDTLTGVEVQAEKYAAGVPDALPATFRPLPFLYQSTGIETRSAEGTPEPCVQRTPRESQNGLRETMANDSPQIVQKLWNYCSIRRDDGLPYGDYVEQLTYLLFLKMAHEQTQPPWKKPSAIPKGFDWPSLDSRDGDDLETHYRHTLETLGKQGGMLGVIFRKAQNKIQDPAKLKRLISDLIDAEQWSRRSASLRDESPAARDWSNQH